MSSLKVQIMDFLPAEIQIGFNPKAFEFWLLRFIKGLEDFNENLDVFFLQTLCLISEMSGFKSV